MLLVLDGVVEMPDFMIFEEWEDATPEFIEAQLIAFFEMMGGDVAKMDVRR